MTSSWKRCLGTSAAALVVVITAMPVPVRADDPSVQDLQRELREMKRQMQQMQEKMERQEKLLEKLGGTGAAASQAAPPAATAPAVTTPPASPAEVERVADEVARRIQPQLAAANKTFAAQFNPAIGFFIDDVFSYSEHDRANNEFRSGELAVSANVDPFARAYGIINGTQDEIEVEEAAIVTTSLPYNLAVKGGRFFADFGRISKFHDHDLPFVNRPRVLDEYVGGESQADGLEASWLVPIPHYLTLTAGFYNKLGGDNDRVDNGIPRDFSKLTYLGRAATFVNLTDEQSLDLGASYAYTPKVDVDNGYERHLVGGDLTYRYTPLSQSAYRGLVWGTEVLVNREHRPVGGFPDQEPDEPLRFTRRDAVGLYSYLEPRLTRRLYPGFLFDYVQAIDGGEPSTRAYSPYLTIWASEFQRFRLQYTYLDAPRDHDNQFFLQWTVIIGSHSHSFRDR